MDVSNKKILATQSLINLSALNNVHIPPLDLQSKKIHKTNPIFQTNSKFFYQLMTKKVECMSLRGLSRENINENARKLSTVLEKSDKCRVYFPEDLMSYIYTIFKNPNSYSSSHIEDLPIIQNDSKNNKPLTSMFPNSDSSKDFEYQWLDIKIKKNFEKKEREVSMQNPNTFENLSKIIKIDPKKLEVLFFQSSGNLKIFMEFLKTKDKKLLWNELEDNVLKVGKENNLLAYNLLTFYKGDEKKLIDRQNFLRKFANNNSALYKN